MSDDADDFRLPRACTVEFPCTIDGTASHPVTIEPDWSFDNHHDPADLVAVALGAGRPACDDLPTILRQARRIAAYRSGDVPLPIVWNGTDARIDDDAVVAMVNPRPALYSRVRTMAGGPDPFATVAAAASYLRSPRSARQHRPLVAAVLAGLAQRGVLPRPAEDDATTLIDSFMHEQSITDRLRAERPRTADLSEAAVLRARAALATASATRTHRVGDTTLTCATADNRLVGILERTAVDAEPVPVAVVNSGMSSEYSLFTGGRTIGPSLLDQSLSRLGTEMIRRTAALLDASALGLTVETCCGAAEGARWRLQAALSSAPWSIRSDRLALLIVASRLGLLDTLGGGPTVAELALEVWRRQLPDEWN
ncbi:hypothetical protein [Gordonia sihwensis]|uniref:hypothetical protein n=1 Tax=Gordonia sihwensis TaxID=173559 RepID=UPI003D9631A9